MAIPKIGVCSTLQATPTSIAWILHYVQDDRNKCHVERKRNISRKGGLPRSVCYESYYITLHNRQAIIIATKDDESDIIIGFAVFFTFEVE